MFMAPITRTHKYLRETSLRTKWNKLLLKFSSVRIPILLIRMIMKTSRILILEARIPSQCQNDVWGDNWSGARVEQRHPGNWQLSVRGEAGWRQNWEKATSSLDTNPPWWSVAYCATTLTETRGQRRSATDACQKRRVGRGLRIIECPTLAPGCNRSPSDITRWNPLPA